MKKKKKLNPFAFFSVLLHHLTTDCWLKYQSFFLKTRFCNLGIWGKPYRVCLLQKCIHSSRNKYDLKLEPGPITWSIPPILGMRRIFLKNTKNSYFYTLINACHQIKFQKNLENKFRERLISHLEIMGIFP